jgi:hypothetical protein
LFAQYRLSVRDPHPEIRLHQALRAHAQKWGERATLAQVYLHFGRSMPGPPVNPADADRHARMVELLKTDPELVRRRRKEGDRHLLSAAARLAVRENALPSELDAQTGEPTVEAVKRLVRGFPYFSFDDDKRGFDQGVWFA